MTVIVCIFVIILVYVYLKKKKEKNILADKKQKLELLREAFHKGYPEIDDNFTNLLNSLGNDDKYNFYRKESSRVFNELLKVFLNIVEADKRLDNMDNLRKKLLTTLEQEGTNSRTKDSIEKSKQLIIRINNESNDLKKYIAKAKEEIKATGIDFVHVTTEIELAKTSGELLDISKLSSRSQTLSYIASNLPVTTETNIYHIDN